MTNNAVDFSVIIPTYNRSSFLRLAILSVLRQKSVSFEIIICDDHSTDDTEKIVFSFQDKRIKYYKNIKRLGTSLNYVKSFKHSKGKYIFTLGDDDFILDDQTLESVLSRMKKYSTGMGKIGTITYEKSYFDPYQISSISDTDLVIKPDNKINILKNTINFGLGFFSGLIFNNILLQKKYLKFDHRCYADHMCASYHSVAYDLIIQHGIVNIPDKFIISRLSLQLIPRFFNMAMHGRLYWQDPIETAKTFLNEKDFIDFQRAYIKSQLVMLPNIQYFSNYRNYFQFLQNVIATDKAFLTDASFYFWAIIGCMPQSLIGLFRSIKILLQRRAIQGKINKYEYNRKIHLISSYFNNFINKNE